VETAFELFATQPVDAVTVADIATAAEMTSAAIYYHYPSREEILLEGLREFAKEYVAEFERITAEFVTADAGMGAFVVPFVQWLDTHRITSIVYFVQSRGASQQIEAIRRDNTDRMIPILASATKRARGRLSAAEASVIAVALIAEIEIFASSYLSEDAAFVTMGRKRFVEAGSRLANRIADTVPV
jgi:AcrR family transcriptional regulator